MRCEDCERTADEWEGWIALRLEPGYGNDELVVLTYCPVCAAQFDEADPGGRDPNAMAETTPGAL